MGGLVQLNDEQLRRLSKLIRNQEILRINDVQFGSEYERVKYIQECKDNHKAIKTLLNNAGDLVAQHKEDQSKSTIAHDVYEHVAGLVNFGIQAIRNYTVRKEFLKKVAAHADDAMKQLRLLNPANEANVRRLAKDAYVFKNAIKHFNAKHADKVSNFFAKQIKEQGLSFKQFVTRYQQKRGLEGSFKDLSGDQKFHVYEDIIKDSGRGQIIEEGYSLPRTSLVVGIALITFTAATMAWDIFSSPSIQMLEKATRNVADLAASVGGSMLGTCVTKALQAAELAIVGAELLVTVAGFIVGSAVGFLLSTLAGWLIDSIFNSGGQVPSTQGFQIFVAPMPDGEALARQIAHH